MSNTPETKTAAPSKRHTQTLQGSSVEKKDGPKVSMPPPLVPSRFQHKSGRVEASPLISESANPKQAAAAKFFSVIYNLGLRDLRLVFVQNIKNYMPEGGYDAFTANESKNRYDDVILLDRTRVKVTINPENDDYIHASDVIVNDKLTYICAQGPLECTVVQFWYMCIERDVKLCKNVENGMDKCFEYIPTKKADTLRLADGRIVIKLLRQLPLPNTDQTVKTELSVTFNNKTARVTHVLYEGWPDHVVPLKMGALLEIRRFVHKQSGEKPIVVHCSAGIGRTGTFVAAEMIVDRILNEQRSDFSMLDVVKSVRDQRALSVQNDLQFLYVIRLAMEILHQENCLSKTASFERFVNDFDALIARKRKELKKKKII